MNLCSQQQLAVVVVVGYLCNGEIVVVFVVVVFVAAVAAAATIATAARRWNAWERQAKWNGRPRTRPDKLE